MFKVQSN